MAQRLEEDLNIIQRSGIEIQVDPLTKDLDIIQKLDDEPNDVGGLSAAELKAKFDEAGNTIKDFINESLIPQVVGADATEAARKANEAQREANEASREAAETERTAAELQRQAGEAAREAAETARETAFTAAQAERAEAFEQAQVRRAEVFEEGEEARNFWEDYDPARSYVPGNKVYYLGSSYVNTDGCTGILPTDENYWQIIARHGQDGSGRSAYQYAVAGGYTGTEAEFQALMGSGPWVPEAGFVPASNPNLLDNWYFPDPINQRGIVGQSDPSSGVNDNSYILDRWFKSVTGVWSLTGNGLLIENIGMLPENFWAVSQTTDRFGSFANRTSPIDVTYSVLINNQLYSTSLSIANSSKVQNLNDAGTLKIRYGLNSGFPNFTLRIMDGFTLPCTINAIKLELGTNQTLAIKNADGEWILNDPPPDKALELLKCQRYLVVFNSGMYAGHRFGMGVAPDENNVRVLLRFPVNMRTTPSVVTSGKFRLSHNMAVPYNDSILATNIQLAYRDTECALLSVKGPVTSGELYGLVADGSDIGRIIFDANL